MGTPHVKVHVHGCVGEAWLLTNPTKTWEPTVGNTEFISQHGNSTTFVEMSEFDVVQSTTNIAVYNPRLSGPTAYFQIWAENDNDPQGKIITVTPINRPGATLPQLGQLLPTIVLSSSIFIPSQIQLDWYYANQTNASGSLMPSVPVEYQLYYHYVGPLGTSPVS